MNEKLKNTIAKTAVLTMRGKLKNSDSVGDDEAELSCLEEDVLDGEYPVIIGHPESWGSPRGQRLLLELKKRDMILLVAIDEFHQGQVSLVQSDRALLLGITGRIVWPISAALFLSLLGVFTFLPEWFVLGSTNKTVIFRLVTGRNFAPI